MRAGTRALVMGPDLWCWAQAPALATGLHTIADDVIIYYHHDVTTKLIFKLTRAQDRPLVRFCSFFTKTTIMSVFETFGYTIVNDVMNYDVT